MSFCQFFYFFEIQYNPMTVKIPLIGNNSFAKTLVNGNSLVPRPANGIIACLIINNYY